ncbi:MAG TPA: dihydroneopterin aldolase [Polyangiaceae bacterium]|jgi:dihydroneopterin aldolase|nr:dihydroneopterin aldolase [Polyangiaceae bacterium]
MDVIRIVGLELDCIVGIFPFERDREQRLRLDVAFGVDTRKAGRSGRISQTVDYDSVAAQLIAMLRFRRYQLIEMAAEELCAMLLATQPELVDVQLSLEKPGALEGRARAAAVEVRRTREDFEPLERTRESVRELQVLRARDTLLSVFEIPAGVQWTMPPLLPDARALWWLVSGRLVQSERSLPVAEAQHELPSAPGNVFRNTHATAMARVFRCVLHGAERNET